MQIKLIEMGAIEKYEVVRKEVERLLDDHHQRGFSKTETIAVCATLAGVTLALISAGNEQRFQDDLEAFRHVAEVSGALLETRYAN
jgi:hypothetical protein